MILSENDTFYYKTKYIDISYHWIRDKVDKKDLKVIYVPDKIQLADPLIKPVEAKKLRWFIETIRLN